MGRGVLQTDHFLEAKAQANVLWKCAGTSVADTCGEENNFQVSLSLWKLSVSKGTWRGLARIGATCLQSSLKGGE